MFSKIKILVLNNKWWTVLLVVIISVVTIFFRKDKTQELETVTVQKHNIVEEVSATGNVKPLSDLDLSFEIGGQVSKLYLSVGDKVYEGQFIVSLSNADLVAAVDQAKAGLKIAEANLALLKNGTRPEELNISKISLDDAVASLQSKMSDAYTKSDDAIRNNIDQIFNNPGTQSAKLNIVLNNSELEYDITSLRYEIESMLNSWSTSISSLSVKTVYSNLDKINLFLDKVALGVNSLTANSNITQTLIDKYKTAVSAARSSISTVYSGLNTVDTSYNYAKANYDLKIAGNTIESINASEATVEQARANLDAAVAKLSKSMIISPISGIITNINAKVGQTIQSGVVAVSVISYGKYDVEAFIPEADIAKIKIGNKARTTLDAYGSNTFFDTEVIKIDPSETVIENVPTYKVTFKFASSSDERIKSGMTANLDILTGNREGVLAVPSRSVYTIDNQKYVKLVDITDIKNTKETKVEIGIRGVDGYVEIISGLKEGDKVVASPKI